MARKHIFLIQGHPDGSQRQLGHQIEAACKDGAWSGDHDVRRVDVGALKVPLLRGRSARMRALGYEAA